MVLCLVLALLLGLIVRVLCCYKGLWLVLGFSVRVECVLLWLGLCLWLRVVGMA